MNPNWEGCHVQTWSRKEKDELAARRQEMLNVTESAKQMLKDLLVANTDKPEFGLRLVASESGQLTLVLGQEKEGDQVIEYQGSKVLLLDGETSIFLDEKRLDGQDTPQGPVLALSKE